VGVLDVKTTSVLCMKFCVCDSVLEKVHANLWLRHRVGLLEMATVITKTKINQKNAPINSGLIYC